MNSPVPAFVGKVLLVSDDATTIAQLSEQMQQFALSPSDVPMLPPPWRGYNGLSSRP